MPTSSCPRGAHSDARASRSPRARSLSDRARRHNVRLGSGISIHTRTRRHGLRCPRRRHPERAAALRSLALLVTPPPPRESGGAEGKHTRYYGTRSRHGRRRRRVQTLPRRLAAGDRAEGAIRNGRDAVLGIGLNNSARNARRLTDKTVLNAQRRRRRRRSTG